MGCDYSENMSSRRSSMTSSDRRSYFHSLQDFILDCVHSAEASSFVELEPRNHAILEDLLDMGILISSNQERKEVSSANSVLVLLACYLASTMSDFYVYIGMGSAGRRLCFCEREECLLCSSCQDAVHSLCFDYFTRLEDTLEDLEELGNTAATLIDIANVDRPNLEISLQNGSMIKLGLGFNGIRANESQHCAALFHGIEQDPSEEQFLIQILENPNISCVMTSSSVISRTIYVHPSLQHVINRYYALMPNDRSNSSEQDCQNQEVNEPQENLLDGSYEFNDLLFPD